MKIVFRFKDKKNRFSERYIHIALRLKYISQKTFLLIVTSLSLMVGDRDTDC